LYSPGRNFIQLFIPAEEGHAGGMRGGSFTMAPSIDEFGKFPAIVVPATRLARFSVTTKLGQVTNLVLIVGLDILTVSRRGCA
jgi:hypothetical protein